MEEKKVSIVLPVYNGADHVANSIESIISQTYRNWELIIVNDCSTDNTLEICNGFANNDSRIKVISNPENLKLPNTLNTGFDLATGDYFTWTSDDNMYKTNALEILVNELRCDPDTVMVYSDYTNIDRDGNVISEVKLQEPQFIVTGNVCGACFLYTADVAKKVGRYDANLFLAEDYDYWIRVYRQGKMKHIMDDLYLYRVHSGSLTETKKSSIQEQTYRTLEKNFLPMYVDAQKNGLLYDFFAQIIRRGQAHAEETKNMLILVNEDYGRYLNRQATKESINGLIRNTFLYKMFRKMKGFIS